ncbi:MAG: helix-turn-helix transcriptional regulator [Spirochaetales bacterium]|nr:helix-turn-helix transcriptional regulator [Spirochaetales bacterium]
MIDDLTIQLAVEVGMNQNKSKGSSGEEFEDFNKNPRFQNHRHDFENPWKSFEIPQKFSKEAFRHFALPSGIEIDLQDFDLKEDFRMDFDMNRAPLAFSFHIYGRALGHITHCLTRKEKVGVRPGQTLLSFNPGARCTVECPAGQRFQVLNIYLSPLMLNNLLGGDLAEMPACLRPVLEGSVDRHYNRSGTITPHMRMAIHQVLNSPYHGLIKRMFLETKAMELITHVLGQTVCADSIHKNSPVLHPDDIEHIHEARDILIRDMENPPSLFELARQVGLNEKKLNLGFRQIFGTTVFDYFRAYRLEKATQLLNEGKMNVTEVAFEVGYVHHCSFSRSFTRYFGISPKAYFLERPFSSF